MPVVYISIGSNSGDRYGNIRYGLDRLGTLESSSLMMRSSLYETEPVGYKDQGWFLNAVVKIETMLEPLDLMGRLKSIEAASGRDFDQVRFGPRTLDLDILLYDDLIVNGAILTVPHPRMHERRFVLRPLCDIDATIVHPVFKISVARLLEHLGDFEQQVVFYK